MSNAVRAKVERRRGESLNSLLKRFREKVLESKVLYYEKAHRAYMKDSQKRRIAQRRARRKQKKFEARRKRQDDKHVVDLRR